MNQQFVSLHDVNYLALPLQISICAVIKCMSFHKVLTLFSEGLLMTVFSSNSLHIFIYFYQTNAQFITFHSSYSQFHQLKITNGK